MIDHVTLRVADLAVSVRFYDAVLAPLGHTRAPGSDADAFVEWGDFSIAADEKPLTRDAHVAFAATSREQVDAFHRAGVAAGGLDNGPPGDRPEYHTGYYAAFLLDPDGHNVEAVFHDRR